MSAWSELKATSRLAIHEFMGLPANIYAPMSAIAVGVTVRIHSGHKLNGDLAGTNLSYAETAERPATALFLNSQITASSFSLNRGVRIILSATEGYHVESIRPADGLTTTVEITPLSASELAALTPPGA
jgi:hypothetical protein